MIMDGMTADNRMINIGYTEMKKPKLKHVFFMIGVVLVQLTAGFGLYQDVKGDNYDKHHIFVSRSTEKQAKNA